MKWNTDEELAALAIAQKQKPRNCTDFEAAEIIYYAKAMFFYHQAQNWAKQPPHWAPTTFVDGARTLVTIIDKGYDAQHKTWWYMGDIPQQERAATILLLMDFGTMLEQLHRRSTTLVAATFWVVLDIILGRTWQARYKKILAGMKAQPA